MSNHNTFTVTKLETGNYLAKSHNFPEFTGQGLTEAEAIDQMNRAICYYRDNDYKGFHKRCKSRTERGLECECGVRLKEKAIGYYI